MSHPLTITAISDTEIEIARRFDAPRPLVFDAWTKPDLVRRWLGIQGGWTMPECEIDLRVGGRYRYLWRGEDGTEMSVSGEFLEIDAPARIVATEHFAQSWYPGGAVLTHEFIEEAPTRTRSRLVVRYDSVEARDIVLASPMEQGLDAGYRNLDGVLAP